MTRSYPPMLATPWPEAFDDDGWWFEVKWDGVRVVMIHDGAATRLMGRSGRDMTASYPEVASLRMPCPLVLDGEVVAFGDDGRPSFQLLQRRMNTRGGRAYSEQVPVTFVAFDILDVGGPLVDRPLEDRYRILADLDVTGLVTSEAVRGEGTALYAATAAERMEGIVAKRSNSPYRPGQRSPDWRKIVHRSRARLAIVGFTVGDGGRRTTIGSLLVAATDAGDLRYVGAVGTGLDERALEAFASALPEIARPNPPTDPAGLPPATWVEPVLTAVVEYRSRTDAGRLRAPVFIGLTDEPPDRYDAL